MRTSRTDLRTLQRLIARAYDAACDVGAWDSLLRDLKEAVGCTGVGLLHHDLGSRGLVYRTVDVHPEAVREYHEHYAALDPWGTSPRAATLVAQGGVCVDEMFLTRAELQRSEYYPWAVRYGISRMMAVIARPDPSPVILSVLRGEAHAPFGTDERMFCSKLLPHVRRAFRVSTLLRDAHGDRAAVGDALDALPIAAVAVSGDARVHFTNRVARLLASTRDGVTIDGGVLRAALPVDTSRLHAAIAAAARVGNGASFEGPPALRLSRAGGMPPLEAIVSPTTSPALFPMRQRPAVIVFLRRPEARPIPDDARLRTLFGFTPAEARLASGLVAGRHGPELAAELHLTRSTGRWLIDRVRQKLGVRTQAQVVTRILVSLASVTAGAGGPRARTSASSQGPVEES